MARIRWLTTLLALPVLIGGCQSASTPVPDPPTTSSGPIGFCVELGGAWNNPKRRCTLTGDSDHTHIVLSYPVVLLDDPTAGKVLKSFVKQFVHQHSITDTVGESIATLTGSVFSHDPNTKSVVFEGDW
ncbi:MAG TPA: hypothetical protein VL179_13190, partial [Mycobacterium sp.]|nr:hypothetical protein [Mycobacterium sp.]